MPIHKLAIRSTMLAILVIGGSVVAADRKPAKTPVTKKAPRRRKAPQAGKPVEPAAPPAPAASASPPPEEEEPVTPEEEQEPTPSPSSEIKPAAGGITTRASSEASVYGDTDHVYVASPSVGATFSDDVAGWSIGGHYLVDVVTAASVDIVSTASSHWREIRHAGSLNASVKYDDVALEASGAISSEPDYLSLTGGGTLTVDLLDKNVTPFLGFSYGQDAVGRTGLPTEFWREKQTLSGRAGLTFVVDRATIASLQLDAVEETGYLAKPYRYIPLFAPGQGASVLPGASIDEVNATRLDQRVSEQLPNRRRRLALSGRLAHRFTTSTIRIDERAYADSWGLLASTSDFRFPFDAGRRLLLWPHLRFHVQNHAVFWQRAYEAIPGPDGTLGIPVIRAGDRELSPMYMATVGGGMKLKLYDDLHKVWALVFEFDASYTRYLDTLYISERKALFGTLGVEAEF
jgi:Protein of unknown function (DUF3570)